MPADRGLVLERQYFFHVDSNEAYPVVEKFASWEFPHSDIPARWRFRIPEARRDGESQMCRVAAATHATELAHIIPKIRTSWFGINHMANYLPRLAATFTTP